MVRFLFAIVRGGHASNHPGVCAASSHRLRLPAAGASPVAIELRDAGHQNRSGEGVDTVCLLDAIAGSRIR
jgi:hypothetical protein